MTARELITASLRLIGALASGENMSASEGSEGLGTLNRMLASWSTENLLIHAITRETPYTLTPSDGAYTMGASGNITTRAQFIESALIRDESGDVAVEFPLQILSHDEWAAIPAKDTEATYPNSLYDDGAYPQRVLYLYPIPSAAHKLVLFTKRPLTTIASLSTDLSFPPGYEEALTYNLALRLAPEYGKQASEAIVMIAIESKGNIKRANIKPAYLRVDDALLSGGGFNFNTGDA